MDTMDTKKSSGIDADRLKAIDVHVHLEHPGDDTVAGDAAKHEEIARADRRGRSVGTGRGGGHGCIIGHASACPRKLP